MNRKSFAAIGALALACAGLTACGGGSGSEASGMIKVNGTEPQSKLIASNVNETGGGRVLDMIYTGLVYYTSDGAIKNDLADSIESKDQKVWTITLQKDRKFSDGTPINAQSFIKAWNYGANPKNHQLNSSWFSIIEGAVEAPEDENAEAPDVPELKGLRAIDEYTFEVTLKNPTSDFRERLGYPVYAPLPEVAFKDMEAYGENPTVTSGPYMMTDKGWVHNEKITLVKNPEYAGPQKPQNDGVEIKFYAKQEAAYSDVQSDRLDVLDEVPESALSNFKNDFKDRSISQTVAIFQSFTIPVGLKHFGMDEEGKLRRQALSMAVNRDEICEKIFKGTRVPAKEFTSPALGNYQDVLSQIKGSEVTKYDPEKAKELWAKADAIAKYNEKFTLAYNSDGGHQAWVDAVVNSIKNTLGIQAEGKAYPDFKGLRDDVVNRKMTGAFRTGWQADYPGMSNFLEPIYLTGASSNDGQYSSAAFDDKIKEVNQTGDDKERNKLFGEAQSILFADLPVIPLWYSNANAVSSNNVKNVNLDWKSVPVYTNVVKVK